jgi:hypothetical protein
MEMRHNRTTPPSSISVFGISLVLGSHEWAIEPLRIITRSPHYHFSQCNPLVCRTKLRIAVNAVSGVTLSHAFKLRDGGSLEAGMPCDATSNIGIIGQSTVRVMWPKYTYRESCRALGPDDDRNSPINSMTDTATS